MLNSLMFILGFTIVFVMLGAAATSVGRLLREYKSLMAQIAGVVIILFGLHLTGILKINALYADKRMHSVGAGKTAEMVIGAICMVLHLGLIAARHLPTSALPRLPVQGSHDATAGRALRSFIAPVSAAIYTVAMAKLTSI